MSKTEKWPAIIKKEWKYVPNFLRSYVRALEPPPYEGEYGMWATVETLKAAKVLYDARPKANSALERILDAGREKRAEEEWRIVERELRDHSG